MPTPTTSSEAWWARDPEPPPDPLDMGLMPESLVPVPLQGLLELLSMSEIHELVRKVEADPALSHLNYMTDQRARLNGFDAIRHLDFGRLRFSDNESYRIWSFLREGAIRGTLNYTDVANGFHFSEEVEMEELDIMDRRRQRVGPPRRTITITPVPAVPLWSDPASKPMDDYRRAIEAGRVGFRSESIKGSHPTFVAVDEAHGL